MTAATLENRPVLRPLLCCSCMRRPASTSGPWRRRPWLSRKWPATTSGRWRLPAISLIKGKWWEIFGDPQLNALEELVNINNQNVKQAEAQFRQARALVAANHANYYPTIGSTPGDHANRHRIEWRARAGGTSQTFSLPLQAATWEPDLWGRVRLSVQNAVDNAQVSAADLENIRLSAQALLATDYFLAGGEGHAAGGPARYDRGLPEEPAAHHQPLQRRRRVANRYYPGANPAGGRAGPEHGSAYVASAVRARHRRADRPVLPAALEIGASKIAAPPPPIPVAVPSQLLERRPDIAANERLVAAANANVGIAQTAYYPTLTLSASAGFLTTDLANLFTYGSRIWSAGPGLSQTLFDFGRRGALSYKLPRPPTTPPSPLTGRRFSPPFRRSRTIWRTCATWPKRRASSRRPSWPPNRR